MPKLSSTYVNSIAPSDKDIILRDTEIKGFICKVTPKGKRVYMYYYRTQDFRERKPVIGYQGTISCDQARDIAKQWQAEVAKGGDPSKDKANRRAMITVTELYDKYMEEYAITKKKSSADEDKRMWNLHILPKLGTYKVSAVIKEDVAKLHSAMSKTPVTANRCRALISKAFNLAESWGYRPEGSNPCRYVKKYSESKKERFLSQDEINDLHHTLNACEKDESILPSAAAAIRLLMLTGCRLSEILTLKWKYVDFDNHILDLPDSKTGPKKVHISPLAAEFLQSLHDDPERDEANPYVVVGKDSESHLINLQKSWRRVRKKANLEAVRLHDLRHTFASVAVAQGLSLPIIGALLGHSQVETTARYAHLANDSLKNAAGIIGGAISNAMKAKKKKNTKKSKKAKP